MVINKQKRFGSVLIGAGVVGLILMLLAAGLTIYQSRDLNERADDILAPLTSGIQGFDEQLDATEDLVDQLLEIVPTATIVELASLVAELTTRLETVNGFIETAKQAVAALDGIPFLPIDLAAIRTDLDELEAGLETLTSQLEAVTIFVLANQDVPTEIAAGIGEAISQIRSGLGTAQTEVLRVSDAVDNWLVAGMVTALTLLTFGVAGQVAIIQFGRQKRRGNERSAGINEKLTSRQTD